MENKKITREVIHVVSRHSNWQAADVEGAFKENGVYAGGEQWARFLNLILPGLGVSLTLAGIIFFFAYNWANMHKFVKLGMVEAGVVLCVVIALYPKVPDLIKNIALLAASVMVGALFSVFGQIYQTGANAYDFFLGWTAFVALWVLISGFAPLWLIGMILVNTTIVLYSEQVAHDWSEVTVFNILFIVNAFVVVTSELLLRNKGTAKRPQWFIQAVALAAIVSVTISIVTNIFGRPNLFPGLVGILLGLIGFSVGLVYGYWSKSIFYISSIAFSIIIIFSALIIKPFEDPIGVFFIVTIFLVGSTTALIRTLIQLNKQWHGGNKSNTEITE